MTERDERILAAYQAGRQVYLANTAIGLYVDVNDVAFRRYDDPEERDAFKDGYIGMRRRARGGI